MKPMIITVFIVSLAFGILIGFFARPLVSILSFSFEATKVAEQHPGVPIGSCVGVPAEARQSCIDQFILRSALKNGDRTDCQTIESVTIREECNLLFDKLALLDIQAQAICESLPDPQVCIDLMQILTAHTAQNVNICSDIRSSDLQENCISIVAPEVLARSEVSTEFDFLPPCPLEDCSENYLAIKEAVLGGDLSLCSNAGIFSSPCSIEVQAYQIATGGDSSGCLDLSSAQDENITRGQEQIYFREACLVDFYAYQSIELNEDACLEIESEDLVAACQTTVDNNPEGRFAYLDQI